MRRVIAIGAFLLCAPLAPAAAKDAAPSAADKVLLEAKAFVAKKQFMEATRVLAEAIGDAQKGKDLATEERLADGFEDVVDAFLNQPRKEPRPPSMTEATRKPTRLVDLLGLVMRRLDAKRHGVFVSAHALATEILLDAAASAEAEYVTDAADVLEAFGAAGRAGRAGAVLAQWGTGVKAARASQAARATPLLEAAEKGFLELGALDLALAASLERAVVTLRASDEPTAVAVLAVTSGSIGDAADVAVVREWIARVRERWAPMPPTLAAALKTAIDRYESAASAGASGGRGGHGASAGVNASPLGRAWKSLGLEKPIVRVSRASDGFTVKASYDDALNARQPVAHGEAPWDEGGVTLLFAGPSVAVRMFDLVGTSAQPGGRSRRSRARAFYVVAPGETLTVTKGGVFVAS